MKNEKIVPRSELHPLPAWGCDPEQLIRNNKGEIVEAVEIVPPKGIIKQWGCFNEGDNGQRWTQKSPKIPVLFPDGVQLEFNTGAFDCVAYTVNALAQSFRYLQKNCLENHTIAFDTRAEMLTQEQFDKLTPRGRQLGSLPSFNAYEDETPLEVTPENERLRTGAGHIHFGFEGNQKWGENYILLAKICDVFVGLPSVMMDVNPQNKLRRTMYGRAGEYRIQPHGFEYRTPSNFWMQSGPLAGFIFGAARFAMAIYQRELNGEKILETIGIPQELVRIAINTNDVKLATQLFEDFLVPFIKQRQGSQDGYWADMLPTFKKFCKKVQKSGLEFFWPDPLTHWCKLPEAHTYGWTWFMEEGCKQMLAKKEVDNELHV